jgi:hypothetical protein
MSTRSDKTPSYRSHARRSLLRFAIVARVPLFYEAHTPRTKLAQSKRSRVRPLRRPDRNVARLIARRHCLSKTRLTPGPTREPPCVWERRQRSTWGRILP